MKKENVLVIDDNVLTLNTVKLFLEEEFSVTTCSDPITALQIAEEKQFKIYVVDYRMPETKGDAVTTQLRHLHPDALIIGYSIESREHDFLAAGANKFIFKDNLVNQLVPFINDRAKVSRLNAEPA